MSINPSFFNFKWRLNGRDVICEYEDKSTFVYKHDHVIEIFDASGNVIVVREPTVGEIAMYCVAMRLAQTVSDNKVPLSPPVPHIDPRVLAEIPVPPEDAPQIPAMVVPEDPQVVLPVLSEDNLPGSAPLSLNGEVGKKPTMH